MSLLSPHFEGVEVDYAIRGGIYHKLGLRPWSIKRPHRTILSLAGNFINAYQSAGEATKKLTQGTHHLIAMAEKRGA